VLKRLENDALEKLVLKSLFHPYRARVWSGCDFTPTIVE